MCPESPVDNFGRASASVESHVPRVGRLAPWGQVGDRVAEATGGDAACPATVPWRLLRSSCRHPAAPAHSPAGQDDARLTRPEPVRSGLYVIRRPGSWAG
jgi:hypothetical protein